LQLAMNAGHASVIVSSRHPGRSAKAAGLNDAPGAGCAGGADGFAGGSTTGVGGFCATGAGFVSTGAFCPGGFSVTVVGGVLHAAASETRAMAAGRASADWILRRASFMMAASIPSRFSMALFLFVLEAVVALALLLGIVWWTWPRKPKDPPRQPPREG
jgi:hypothetical protein